MTFLYRYQDGAAVREERIKASSEADAYSLLRKSGVRPMKVWPAPGFLNRLSALGKRGLAIVVLSAVCGVLSLVLYFALRTPHSALSAQPRHQIYGDPALMSELRASGYANVFENEGDRILAFYAQPGVLVQPSQANHEALTADATFTVAADDPREVRELKAIVLGMKDELRDYLANGIGTPRTYLDRLDARQRKESEIFSLAVDALKDKTDPSEYEKVNASLRRIGLKTIPIPANRNSENTPLTGDGDF